MTDLRADLEAAYWDHWRKALRDNPRDGLPAFLDALEAIDREHAAPRTSEAGPKVVITLDDGTAITPSSPIPPPGKPAPQPRRRTTRKESA